MLMLRVLHWGLLALGVLSAVVIAKEWVDRPEINERVEPFVPFENAMREKLSVVLQSLGNRLAEDGGESEK